MFVGTLETLVVTRTLLDKLDYSGPVAKPHTKVKSQILAVNILVDLFGFVVSLEVSGDLRLLLELFI